MIRFDSRTQWYVLCGLLVLSIIWGATASFIAVRRGRLLEQSSKPVISPNRPAQLDPQKAQRNYPKDSPEEVVRLFLEATDWQQKLAYVRHPEKVKPLLEEYYRTNPGGRATFLDLYVTSQKDDIEAAGWVSVLQSVAKVKNDQGQETDKGYIFVPEEDRQWVQD